MKWLIKLASLIKIPYKRKVSFDELTYFRTNDLKGALLMCFTPYQFTNIFVRGTFKHVEIIGGSDGAIGAVSEGVRVTEIKKILEKCKKYAVIFPTKPIDREMVVVFAWTKRGLPYDSNFGESDARFYCSELAVDSYNFAGYNLDYGRIIHPIELKDDVHNFKVVKEFEA